jgi:hypothetical protein
MKTGTKYIITEGCYSDYGITDSFVALKTFSFDKALARWLAAHGDNGDFGYSDGQTIHDFLEWLRSEGYVAEEKLHEVHIGDYGRPDEMSANDAGDEP